MIIDNCIMENVEYKMYNAESIIPSLILNPCQGGSEIRTFQLSGSEIPPAILDP